MNFKNISYTLLIVLTTYQSSIISTDQSMPAYQNVISQIKEIHGSTTYTLILHTQRSNPIINYSPASYQESLQDSIYRAYMPNTALAPTVHEINGLLLRSGTGIDIVLPGKLMDKRIIDNLIMLHVKTDRP